MLHQALLAVALATAAIAQVTPPLNVSLLAKIDTRTRYSGVWGYTAPDGREFAIVGEYLGTWVVETTDPTAPVERGFFPAPASRWREITSHGSYVYSVSEHHAGVRVIDMTSPGQPVDRGYVRQSDWGSTHTISVDPDRGLLFCNGCSGALTGMNVLDAAANPLAPTVVGRFTLDYVHDSHIRRGTAYLSEINRGMLRILDVRDLAKINLAAATIARFPTDGATTHSAWVSADDELLITTDENLWGRLRAWDIRNPATPAKLGDYGTNGHIVHNIFMIGRTAYIAHNSEGFHMVDLADPTTITRVASYDTSAYGSGTGYTGSWGCYPFADHGAVYMSDREEGLVVLRVEAGHVNRYGRPSRHGGGGAPHAAPHGATPRVGAARFGLALTGLAPNGRFALLLGLAPGSTTALGIELLVDLATAFAVDGTADGSGEAVVPLPIPADPGLAGSRVYAQVIAIDPRAAAGLSASRGLWFGIAR